MKWFTDYSINQQHKAGAVKSKTKQGGKVREITNLISISAKNERFLLHYSCSLNIKKGLCEPKVPARSKLLILIVNQLLIINNKFLHVAALPTQTWHSL